MQDIFTVWPELIPWGILFVLIAILVLSLILFRERKSSEILLKDRWRCWARRTAIIQVVFFLIYPMFISDGFEATAVPFCLVPITWGFYNYFGYRTKGEYYVGLVGGALSVFWIYFAWISNIEFLFTQ